jgi:hypothetical protein
LVPTRNILGLCLKMDRYAWKRNILDASNRTTFVIQLRGQSVGWAFTQILRNSLLTFERVPTFRCTLGATVQEIMEQHRAPDWLGTNALMGLVPKRKRTTGATSPPRGAQVQVMLRTNLRKPTPGRPFRAGLAGREWVPPPHERVSQRRPPQRIPVRLTPRGPPYARVRAPMPAPYPMPIISTLPL